jgi:MFS family permease
MSSDPGLRDFLKRHPDYTRFWGGMFVVQIGGQIQAVTIGWQVYTIGRETMSMAESAFLVGMIGLAQFVPLFALTLYAGHLADRISRGRIVLVALFSELIGVIGLTALALQERPALWMIFTIAGLFGAARAFLSPAATSVVPMLVPRAEMPRAISLKSLSWQSAVIVGPWLGGMLCSVSTSLAYGTTAVLYATGMAVILGLKANTTPVHQPGKVLAQIADGIAYVWGNKIILGAMSLDLFAVLLGGATALLPAFAKDVLHVGPEGFGILRSGPAIGAVIVALMLARWPLKRQAGARMFLAVTAFGLATVVFGLSRSMWLSVLALAAMGAADMISVYVRQTLVQIVTPDHMRGRVSSVSGLFISGSNELGEFESGVVSRLIGPVAAVVSGGIGTIGVTALWAWLFPALRKADRLDGASPEREETLLPHAMTAPASTP